MPQNVIAQQKLWLTADKSALVADGDERAATLFCAAGDEILPEAHERFGLVDGALPSAKKKAPAEKKPKAPAETKPKAPAETKGA